MSRFNRVIAAVWSLVVLTACERGASELSQRDQDAIRASINKRVQAALAADWDTWGTTLAADYYDSPPNRTPVRGREAMVAWAKTFPKITDLTVNADEITGRGDLAYARGTYTQSVTLPDGSPMTERGSFLQIHRRQPDGTWLYTHVAHHSTDALPAPPPTKAK